jgi:hypothetical protein
METEAAAAGGAEVAEECDVDMQAVAQASLRRSMLNGRKGARILCGSGG